MNVINLIGRLTRDVELKQGNSGKSYTRFSIAVNRPFQKDEVDFINCVAFGKTAELIGEYIRKGQQIGLTGRLQMNRYEVNGEKRTSYDVIVESFYFISSNSDRNTSNTSSNNTNDKTYSNDTTDEEFPF